MALPVTKVALQFEEAGSVVEAVRLTLEELVLVQVWLPLFISILSSPFVSHAFPLKLKLSFVVFPLVPIPLSVSSGFALS